MTPQFTTPCYVRIEDADQRKEICDKLEHLGYHIFKAINNPSGDTIFTDLFFADGSYTNEPSYAIWKNYILANQLWDIHIDCGTNTELFLALAGMRSDTDKGQRFTDGEHWYIMNENKKGDDEYLIDGHLCHRATAAEIVEHFNNKTK